MSTHLPKSIQNLIDEFSRLPGIGPKTAERLAIHLLHSPHSRIKGLGDSVLNMKDGVEFCSVCWHLSDNPVCKICSDSMRMRDVVCVVEQVLDVVAIEKSGAFHGVYHVLHGVLSPIDGIGPENLKLYELEKRAKEGSIKEIILAVNPSVEGETTAMYITKMLKNHDIQVTRIARGLPVGGELGYADESTISRAMMGRMKMD
ncbi:MAG: recombination mediator RecR [Candidatus Moraniibacteriota bacterium]